MSKTLDGRVALVTGASRGVGRGIAHELGLAGATVYVTGRSVAGATTEGRLETIESTAELVTGAGGKGIALACDHGDDSQVIALFEKLPDLDLLVNNVWGGYENYDHTTFSDPFWNQPMERFERMFRTGPRAHFVAARLAAPGMIARKRGLIVNIAAGDHGRFLGNVPYDLAKSMCSRMAFGMATNLRPHNVAAVCVLPGFTRTERVTDAFSGSPPPNTETPRFTGRVVAALAADANIMQYSGRVQAAASWAKVYGIADIDGRAHEPFVLPPEYPAPPDRF
ncbi:MAG: SDR family NAD(P)-dependent oxidoreductase [Planctomycetes bacterium]|nr:SDR family NAD(P)-dependent oxidoreductase [Planctomycetota bacterium]